MNFVHLSAAAARHPTRWKVYGPASERGQIKRSPQHRSQTAAEGTARRKRREKNAAETAKAPTAAKMPVQTLETAGQTPPGCCSAYNAKTAPGANRKRL